MERWRSVIHQPLVPVVQPQPWTCWAFFRLGIEQFPNIHSANLGWPIWMFVGRCTMETFQKHLSVFERRTEIQTASRVPSDLQPLQSRPQLWQFGVGKQVMLQQESAAWMGAIWMVDRNIWPQNIGLLRIFSEGGYFLFQHSPHYRFLQHIQLRVSNQVFVQPCLCIESWQLFNDSWFFPGNRL